MHFQFEVAPPTPSTPASTVVGSDSGVSELLKRLVEIQTQQLAMMRAALANQDHLARWRALLARRRDDYPETGRRCKEILPPLEKAYLQMIDDLAERLSDREAEGIDNEFSLNEFLDRYGSRLSQLGTILGLIGTLADAGADTTT